MALDENPNVTDDDLAAVEAALEGPRNLAYHEALAFVSETSSSARSSNAHALRAFIDACGDRGVLRRIVGMLVG